MCADRATGGCNRRTGITFRNGKISAPFEPANLANLAGGGGLSLAGNNCKVSIIKCRFESNSNLVKNTDPIKNGWGGAVFIFPSMLSVDFTETARALLPPSSPPVLHAAKSVI